MPINFSCPHCQSRMQVPDNLGGKRGRCSKCKQASSVPLASDNGAAAPQPAPAATAPRTASTPARPAPPPPPPPRKGPAPPTVNLEDEAAALLADEPAEVDKLAELIEF